MNQNITTLMDENNTEKAKADTAAAEMLEHHKRKLQHYQELVVKTKNTEFLSEYRKAIHFHRGAIENHGTIYNTQKG